MTVFASEKTNDKNILDVPKKDTQHKNKNEQVDPLEGFGYTPEKNSFLKYYSENEPSNSFFFYNYKSEFLFGAGSIIDEDYTTFKTSLTSGFGFRHNLKKENYIRFAFFGVAGGSIYTQFSYGQKFYRNYRFTLYGHAGLNLSIQGNQNLASFFDYTDLQLLIAPGIQSHLFWKWFSLSLETQLLASFNSFQFLPFIFMRVGFN